MRDVVLMVEVAQETRYVGHHQQKIAFILAAMRHFAGALRGEGLTVDYVALDDPTTPATSSSLQPPPRTSGKWRS